MRGEIVAPAMRLRRAPVAEITWSEFAPAIANREFAVVLCFCGLGFLISICLMLLVPDYGAIAEPLGL